MNKFLSQINIKSIGKIGQEKIHKTSIALVGLGGLGSPILDYLSAAGIGCLKIIDDDIIEISNLSRQLIYNIHDIDEAKIDIAEKRAKLLNKDINIEKHFIRLNDSNINKILKDDDIIVDASDNFKTRYLLNQFCHDNAKILVSGSAIKMQGYLSVYKSGLDKLQPCFSCFHNIDDKYHERSCVNDGALGPVVGVIGCMMATEVIKEITMPDKSIAGDLIYYNAETNRFKTIKLAKRNDCICG
ncbi:MAG: HesA/MoeB/ThiF family protein [Rickettsiales bacterium]|nr:HesA/MoeB/ThiF family protein [Rickettsiales bacterium]